MLGEKWTGYWFVLPGTIMLAVILGFPAVTAILESVGLVGGKGGASLANYTRLLGDTQFHATTWNTLVFVVAVVTFHLVMGLAVALLLNLDVPGRWVFRVLAILPWTMPDVIGGLVFRSLFDTLTGGVNAVGMMLGLMQEPKDWLGSPSWALFSVIMAESWRGYPYVMLILLAGLQSIPRDQYEAAAIDGAGWWTSLFHVTLPNLKPMIVIALVLDIVWECRLFGMIYGMTGGGPGDATQNLSLMVYKQYFQFFDTAYASSVAVVLAAVLLVVALPYMRSTLRKEA
ncbi:MAG TPA: sugar ABC transporter permease [Bosea sp. (in: a-proteobacteria)]|jgi:multiple sugar transport system permease protein|uniref:carbohydrate ABC transporter permease n=1 Tax=Bosea sp. (in: a-proteobacteria) TaxID=1871050 RepID=UPI002E10C048|nr:sugar ABC transporter permease [Bosea sp. (in: a-proteobacteria)]